VEFVTLQGPRKGPGAKRVATFLQQSPAHNIFNLSHRGDDLKAEVLQLGNDLALVAVIDATACQIPGQLSLPGM
jgi:hypothetical protein